LTERRGSHSGEAGQGSKKQYRCASETRPQKTRLPWSHENVIGLQLRAVAKKQDFVVIDAKRVYPPKRRSAEVLGAKKRG